MPADHGNAAGHEFAEIVARRPQHPEFGRGKPGIALGHGHATGADVAGHENLALGHAVAGAVGRIAMDDDLGAGVEPADVVGSRPHDLDHRIVETQGAGPLARGSGDAHMDLFITRLPQPPPDAVVAVGLDQQPGVALGHGRLNLFFQKPRFDALSVDFSGYNKKFLVTAHELFSAKTVLSLKYKV